MPTRTKAQQKLTPAAKAKFEKALWKRLGATKAPAKVGLKALGTARAGIATITPDVASKEVASFTHPNVGPGGVLLEPNYITEDCTIIYWQSQQFGTIWDFEYRAVGDVNWLTPAVVFGGSGGQRAIVLPSGAYEVLPTGRQ